MGLRCSFSIDSVGLPEYLEDDEYGIFVEIDYSAAFDAFVDRFLSTSRQLVPVDTGYLRSTLAADTDGYECEAITICEYAQYPEFGTIYQNPQPYFTPAVEDGWQAFVEEAMYAINDAEIEFEEQLEEAIEEEMEEEMESMSRDSMPSSFGQFATNMIVGAALFFILFPILIYAYAIARTFTDAMTGNSGRSLFSFGGSVSQADIQYSMPDIEII